jgi:hypothetical protein
MAIMLYIFNEKGNRQEDKIGKILPMGYTPKSIHPFIFFGSRIIQTQMDVN